MDVLPQCQGLGLESLEATGAALSGLLGKFAMELLDKQTHMEVDGQVANPLDSLEDGSLKTLLRLGQFERDKKKTESEQKAVGSMPLPLAPGAAPAASQSDAGLGSEAAETGVQAPATPVEDVDGITLAKDSGKVQERIAGGRANRDSAGPYQAR